MCADQDQGHQPGHYRPAVTFTLPSPRLLTHWPQCWVQMTEKEQGKEWSKLSNPWSPLRAWPLMVINTRDGRSLLQMLHIALGTQVYGVVYNRQRWQYGLLYVSQILEASFHFTLFGFSLPGIFTVG